MMTKTKSNFAANIKTGPDPIPLCEENTLFVAHANYLVVPRMGLTGHFIGCTLLEPGI